MSTGALEEIAHQLEQLAIEQYTANLIAFYESVPTPRLGEDTQKLREQIMERLGLA